MKINSMRPNWSQYISIPISWLLTEGERWAGMFKGCTGVALVGLGCEYGDGLIDGRLSEFKVRINTYIKK